MGPFLSAHDIVTRRAMREALWFWRALAPIPASVWGDGATVWFCEGALPRSGEKCESAVCNLRSGELVHGSQELLRAMAV